MFYSCKSRVASGNLRKVTASFLNYQIFAKLFLFFLLQLRTDWVGIIGNRYSRKASAKVRRIFESHKYFNDKI